MKKRLVFALSTTLLCYLLFLFFSPLYYSSDSLMAAIVVDGLFSANNFSQFQHPLFCIIVRILTPLLPTVDVFTLILHLTVALGIFSMAYYLSAPVMVKPLKSWRVPDFIYIIILLLGIVFLSAGVNIWNINYTITAGAFVFMGLVLLFPHHPVEQGERCKRGQRITSTILIAMGIMLRRESALLFLPFIILDLTISVMEQRYEWKHVFRRYMPCLLAFLLLIGSREIMYSIEPYATASRYNDARTAIMDFPMKGATEVDIDSIDYTSAINYWTFADTENMDVEKLEEIATAGTKNAFPLSWAGFTAVMSKIKHDVFHTNLYMSILVVVTALLLLRNLLCARLWGRIESVLAVVGGLLIMIYFTFRGRAPMRVWEPVLMATDYLMIRVAATPRRAMPGRIAGQGWRSTVNTVAMLLIAVTLWFSAGQVMAYSKLNAEIHTTLNARSNVNNSEYKTDTLYIWPNWHGTIPKYYEDAGTLPSQDVIEHNIALGDWTYGQPYYNMFLSRIGAENPVQMLVEGKAFIMGNGIEAYLRHHYGDDIRLVETGAVIEGLNAYRVERIVDNTAENGTTETDNTAVGDVKASD